MQTFFKEMFILLPKISAVNVAVTEACILVLELFAKFKVPFSISFSILLKSFKLRTIYEIALLPRYYLCIVPSGERMFGTRNDVSFAILAHCPYLCPVFLFHSDALCPICLHL